MILSRKRHVIEAQCEMCGQEFEVPRRDFLDEESCRYCLPCQQAETVEMTRQWLIGGEDRA
jgi:hypothetical protein